MRLATLPEGTAYAAEGRFFHRGRDATSGGDDEDPALTRALACEETRWATGTWSPDRTVRDLHFHDVVVVLGGALYFARMGDVAPGSRVLFDGVVHETRFREGSIEVRRTEVVLSEVVATFVRDADALVEVAVVSADGAAHTIVGTPEHPIFVPEREAFVPLGDLRPGASLRTTGGGDTTVQRVRALSEGAPVYNIEVAHTHTYFAGGHALARGEVLVHNQCDPPPPPPPGAPGLDPETPTRPNQAVAEQIGSGHALEKHLGEFADLGITTEAQLQRHIENVMDTTLETRSLERDRTAYWDDATGTIVVHDPNKADGGTAFRPPDGRHFFDNIIH